MLNKSRGQIIAQWFFQSSNGDFGGFICFNIISDVSPKKSSGEIKATNMTIVGNNGNKCW